MHVRVPIISVPLLHVHVPNMFAYIIIMCTCAYYKCTFITGTVPNTFAYNYTCTCAYYNLSVPITCTCA